jgi:hypothetical protein
MPSPCSMRVMSSSEGHSTRATGRPSMITTMRDQDMTQQILADADSGRDARFICRLLAGTPIRRSAPVKHLDTRIVGPRSGRSWPGAPFDRPGSVKHPDSGIAQPGNVRSCYKPDLHRRAPDRQQWVVCCRTDLGQRNAIRHPGFRAGLRRQCACCRRPASTWRPAGHKVFRGRLAVRTNGSFGES